MSGNGHQLNGHHGDAHLDRMRGVLTKAHARFFKKDYTFTSNGERATDDDPSEQLMALEEQAEREMQEAAEEYGERAMQIAWRAFRDFEAGLIQWFFADGPDPLAVQRRLFMYVKKKNAALLWNMGFRDLGMLFDLSHGTLQWQAKMLFGDCPGGAQKTAAAKQKMSAAAKGNVNRLGGKKAHPSVKPDADGGSAARKPRQLSFTRKLKVEKLTAKNAVDTSTTESTKI